MTISTLADAAARLEHWEYALVVQEEAYHWPHILLEDWGAATFSELNVYDSFYYF